MQQAHRSARPITGYDCMKMVEKSCPVCGVTRMADSRGSGMCKPCSAKRAAQAAKARHASAYEAKHGRVSPGALGLNPYARTFSPLHIATCRATGSQYLSRRSNAICRCHLCEQERKRQMRERARDANPLRADTKPCRTCGKPMDVLRGYGSLAAGAYTHVCGECRAIALRKAQRIAKDRRKARQRGATADESIDAIAVFIRDGWRCQSCGCNTPRSLRGSQHSDAPELDHIVPLALGGAHTHDNVQCLCRTCNGLKGAMHPDQWAGYVGAGGMRCQSLRPAA
jgi:5-methylcytosine-specific restriction endonuclease McrA